MSDALTPYGELWEALADLAHERWSHWTRWQFQICERNADGTITIPATLVERWERQSITRYAALSEKEKDSDRAEVDKTLALINEKWYLTLRTPKG